MCENQVKILGLDQQPLSFKKIKLQAKHFHRHSNKKYTPPQEDIFKLDQSHLVVIWQEKTSPLPPQTKQQVHPNRIS